MTSDDQDEAKSDDAPNTDGERSSDPKSPRGLVLVVFAVVFGLIGSCAAYYLWPRGDLLGGVDLRSGEATLAVDLAAGDALVFRFDRITVGTKSGYPDSSRSRTNAVHDELEASRVAVTLEGKDGAAIESTTCGAFAGKSTTGSSEPDRVVSSGLPIDCSLKVRAAGAYTVKAKVAWVPKDVREARLEVRRVKTGK